MLTDLCPAALQTCTDLFQMFNYIQSTTNIYQIFRLFSVLINLHSQYFDGVAMIPEGALSRDREPPDSWADC